jgi:hypothetical protein
VVTSATIEAIKVPTHMGKGQYIFADDGSGTGIQAFLRAYRDEFVLSTKSGVPVQMGLYVTLFQTVDGRVLLLDWTYFGEDMAAGILAVDAWARAVATREGLTVLDSVQFSDTYEEYVAQYSAKVPPATVPEEWLSPLLTTLTNTYIASLFTSSDTAIAHGALYAITLVLGQQFGGKPAGLDRTGNDKTSAFPYRSAKFWLLNLAGCDFADLPATSPCREYTRNVLQGSKLEKGYLGLYYGIQTRLHEEARNDAFIKEYFGNSQSRYVKLTLAKKKWDPENKFCAPQSVIPCAAPSSDACVPRSQPAAYHEEIAEPGETRDQLSSDTPVRRRPQVFPRLPLFVPTL